MSTIRTLGALGAAALLLAACSSGGEATPSGSSTPAPTSSSAAPSPTSGSPSPTDTTESIFASLCDEATPEQVAVIEAAMKPEFTVSQLVDVRTDDAGKHAILGFVEGPGLAVLAQWTGTGPSLDGLASADEFSAEASTAPRGSADDETEQLLGATIQCYTTLFAEDS